MAINGTGEGDGFWHVRQLEESKAESFVARVERTGLLGFPESAIGPPDGSFVEIGVLDGKRLRRFMWTEDMRYLSATRDAPTERERAFAATWFEVRNQLTGAVMKARPVNGDTEALVERIASQLPK